ncbi:MAG: glycerol-3-phosphate 1-O-acyltransferase PlsY [Tissierellia bacterium]|nr:glycerol-3-phosphate 1-O-acyltransferase PlsY [Tissierellia bacterium]
MFLFFIIAYLMGNFSSAYILGKLLYKTDIRTKGSGNAGATNALRNFGPKIGVLTLILDLLKGALAVYIADRFGAPGSIYLAGLGVVLGHNWPAFFGFRGGKGMATSCGVLLYLDYRIVIVLFIVFLIFVIISRYVSLGSVMASVLAPFAAYYFDYNTEPELFYLTLILAIIAVYKHRENIKRIINKNENRLTFKEKNK